MSTTNQVDACPALHTIAGAMGPGRWPEHAPDERGVCVHCHTTTGHAGDRKGPAVPWSHRPWHA